MRPGRTVPWKMSALTDPSCESISIDSDVRIRQVRELPLPYQDVFRECFEQFNRIQSSMFDLVMTTDKTLAICAPTGSGKTVMLELAIIRELIKVDQVSNGTNPGKYSNFHALYLAPLKAIVQEKCTDWQSKFRSFGLRCLALTGDTEIDDYIHLKGSNYSDVNILLATPEKFDFLIRTDPESRQLLRVLQLVLIDEIHMLGDRQRGDILEATITRIKAIRDNSNNLVKILNSITNPEDSISVSEKKTKLQPIRFVAISATAPNVDDISAWLDIRNGLGVFIEPEMRPVKLNKIVIGFDPIKSSFSSEYRFDIQLSYKLENVIRRHSSGKPALVFCATRKSVEFTAKVLSSSQMTYFESNEQRTNLYYELSKLSCANMDNVDPKVDPTFKNCELKETLKCGIGFYHSGMDFSDRRLLEQLFAMSLIPVLISTSSLAMGVNLPAHLVVIKNTVQYHAGSTVEYDVSQVLQMIGRAGRPQFDSTATAVILTKNGKRAHYESLLSTQKTVESNLFRTLAEQLTIEVVLKTVTNINSAIDWICSTFMFLRIVKNPAHYRSDIPQNDFNGAHPYILAWCNQIFSQFRLLGLIKTHENLVEPTTLARIITRYSISLESTEKLIAIIKSKHSLEDLLTQICDCKEIHQDIILRVNEKRFLNEMNKLIRFKFKGRFKTNLMKINCLTQALFDSLAVESCLLQDCNKLLRSGQRVTRCLVELLYYLFNLKHNDLLALFPDLHKLHFHFETIVTSIRLGKAFRSKLWHDSRFVVKQLPKIGTIFSHTLVERGYTSFETILNANPREIEFCVKRNPPFGSYLIDEVKSLPHYVLNLKQTEPTVFRKEEHCSKVTSVIQINIECMINDRATLTTNKLLKPQNHFVYLVVGCCECDTVILLNRFSDEFLRKKANSLMKQVLIVLTNFKQSYLKHEGIEEDPSKVSKKEGSKSNSSKKKKSKEESEEKARQFEKINSADLLSFYHVLADCKSYSENFVFHLSHAEDRVHTIEAMLLSESFVGLDVEMKLEIQFTDSTVANTAAGKRFFQNTDQQEDLGADWSDGLDDADLVELLDDYNDKVLKNKINPMNDDSDSSLPDPVDKPVCVNQAENQDFNKNHPNNRIASFIVSNDAPSPTRPTTPIECVTESYNSQVKNNLMEKVAIFKSRCKIIEPPVKKKPKLIQSICSSQVVEPSMNLSTSINNLHRLNFLTSIRKTPRKLTSKYFAKKL